MLDSLRQAFNDWDDRVGRLPQPWRAIERGAIYTAFVFVFFTPLMLLTPHYWRDLRGADGMERFLMLAWPGAMFAVLIKEFWF